MRKSDLDCVPSQFPDHTPTITSKHILLQFETPEDTLKVKQLFDLNKNNFLKGAYTDSIL